MFNTVRLNARAFKHQDLDLLYKLHSNPEVAATTIDGIQSLEQVKKHLDNFINHQEKYGYSQFAIFEKASGNFVGRAGLTKRTLSEEVGEQIEVRFALMPEFWGLGYATELTEALIAFARDQLKVNLITASCGLYNARSDRVLTKFGFKFIKEVKPEGYGTSNNIKYYELKLL